MSAPFEITATPLTVFSPTQISNCALWLDANDTTTISRSGTTVNSWTDKIANIPFVPTNGSGITYSNTVVNLASQTFLKNSSGSINVQQTFTMFMVAANSTGSQSAAIYISPNGGGEPGVYVEWPTPTNYRFLYRSPAGISGGNSVFIPAPGVLPLTIGSFYRNTSGANYELGMGINGGTPSTVSDTQSSVLGSSTQLAFGVLYNTGGYFRFLTGSYAEILFYTTSLSVNQRQQVEGYLAWKWSLQANLPSDHPYKTVPVTGPYPFPSFIRPSINTVSIPRTLTNDPVFSPPNFAGCQLWLDAADANSVVLSGSTVTQWRDKSGNGQNATAVGTIGYANNRMVWNTAAGTRFQGNIVNTNTTGSLFMAMSVTGNTQNRWFFSASPNSSTVTYATATAFNIAMASGGTNFRAYRNNANLSFGNYSNTNTLFFYGNIFDGASNTTFTNGTSGTSVASIGSFNLGFYEIGSSIAEENLISFDGTVGEVIYYTTALTTAQRQQVEGYLAWKWGLISSLPTGHPYKTPPIAPFAYAVRSGSQVAPFNPTSITGCQLWLDANDTSTITGSSPITAWTDKSGTSRTVTFAGTSNIYNSTTRSVNTNNGNTSYFFANVNLKKSLVTYANVFIAHTWTGSSLSGANQALWGQDVGGGWNRFQLLGFTATPSFAYGLSYTPNSPNLTTVSALNTANRMVYSAVYAYQIPNGTFVNVNGSLASALVTEAVSPSETTTTNTYFGSIDTGYAGSVAFHEIIIYTGLLTLNQRQTVEGYLAWKWGTQASLPANHPYKLFPPK